MISVKTAVVMQKMATSGLKKAMDNQNKALETLVDALNAQKAAKDALNTATDKHHKAMFLLILRLTPRQPPESRSTLLAYSYFLAFLKIIWLQMKSYNDITFWSKKEILPCTIV